MIQDIFEIIKNIKSIFCPYFKQLYEYDLRNNNIFNKVEYLYS